MYFNLPRVISVITRTHSSLWEETQHGRLLVYSGCSTNSLEFHSLSQDDGACGNCIYFFVVFFFFFVLSHSRMQCLLSHSHKHTRTYLIHANQSKGKHARTSSLRKTQLAQIIKINTLEAWHYAKENFTFSKEIL